MRVRLVLQRPGLLIKSPAGDVAAGPHLQPETPRRNRGIETPLFETRVRASRPWFGASFSLFIHSLMVFGIAAVHFTPLGQEHARKEPEPTQLRIGDKLYYVS